MSKETEHLKLFKYDKETDNFDATNFNITQALNNNWDKIDSHLESANTQLADIVKQQSENKEQINTSIEEIEKKITNYNSYASNKDSNGIYTVVEYKDKSNQLYMKSTLSSPDSNGNYKYDTWQFYKSGSVISTIKWTMTYDEDSNIVSKVVS
jgi:hypothetical protein